MKPYEKAWDILNKLNNKEITVSEWYNASDFAKDDLKRKALIVVDEVINTDMLIDEEEYVETPSYLIYWQMVREILIDL